MGDSVLSSCERVALDDRLALVGVLQELTASALELFDAKRSLDDFLQTLAARLGASVAVCVERGSTSPVLVGAAGLARRARLTPLPSDFDPFCPVPPIEATGATRERWVFADDGHWLILCFEHEPGSRYRAMTAQVWRYCSFALQHRELLERALESERRLKSSSAELERRVAERTLELEAANVELELSLQSLKETQAQLLRAAKLVAVGQLAAGIAHELNNPLTVILGYAQGMGRRVSEGDELQRPLTAIARESHRCKGLVRQLLDFARTSPEAFERIDVGELVRGSVSLLELRASGQSTRIRVDLSEVPTIWGNRSELEQVLVNLGNNALDAVEREGTVTVGVRAFAELVVISVHDTGPGISEGVMDRMFEPFFTTKEVGKGTGLGLSLSLQIVERHRGKIEARSRPGEGTLMTVSLPLDPSGT
ncbi:MAG: hypothetical protein HY791_07690 [Deltaproteobacteria bacterium]|nr:hypothetical protein [Deltaproteobacteria bacterium]